MPDSTDKQIYEMGHLVECPKIKPLSLVPVSDCRQCEYHVMVRKVRDETPDKCPHLFDVMCGKPRAQRVHNVVTFNEQLADAVESRLLLPQEVRDGRPE